MLVEKRFQILAQESKHKSITINLAYLSDAKQVQSILDSNRYKTHFRELKRRIKMNELDNVIQSALGRGVSEERILKLFEEGAR